MIKDFFVAVFYQPLYNGLISLINFIPWADAGVVVVLFTLIVKLVLFPLSRKAVVTQLKIKKLQPELEKIKKEHEKDKQEQARRMMAFYKEKGINPFSSIFLVLIQMPIVISLYFIFLREELAEVNQELLYNFVSLPESINVEFLGFMDITARNFPLAFLVGIASYYQIKFSAPELKPKGKNNSFKEDFARSMNLQMRYVFPLILFFVAYTFSGVIALYLLTSSLFTIGQELYVRKKLKKEGDLQ